MPGAPPADLLECLLARERVSKEDLEQALVAQNGHVGRPGSPFDERRAARIGQLVLLPLSTPGRRELPGDEACLLEAPQVRIDLPVARVPEEPRRLVDDALDVVPRAGAEAEHPEDDVCGWRELDAVHASARYIFVIYLSTISRGEALERSHAPREGPVRRRGRCRHRPASRGCGRPRAGRARGRRPARCRARSGR